MARILLVALLVGVMGCSGGNGNGVVDGGDAGDGDPGTDRAADGGYVNGDDAGAGGDDAGVGGDDAGVGGDDAGTGGDDGGIVEVETECNDDQDNDNDGLTDCEDTDCGISGCGLDIIGGIFFFRGINQRAGTSGGCAYAGHQIYEWPNPGDFFGITHHGRWFKAFTAGDCYFLAELMECGTACPAGQWCNPGSGACENLPATAHAGTLTLTGLGPVSPVTVTLNPDANGYYTGEQLDFDNSYNSSSTITMTASGGPTPAFTVSIQGIDVIEPPLQCTQALPPQGQDYVFTWTPANDGSWVRLHLPTWHHAGMGSAVICEAPDTGSLTVPAVMVNYYLAAGATEQRTYTLERIQQAVVDLGDGRGVALGAVARRDCDFYH